MPSAAGPPREPRPREVRPRSLAQLCAQLGIGVPAGSGGHVPVSGITHDSRAVRRDDLYAALPGARFHGARFAAAAVAAGASAVLTDPPGSRAAASCGAPVLVVDDPRARLGALAAWLYGEPARALTLVGITGTNGKTTTAYFVEAILRAAGRRTGLIGTIETRVGDDRVPSVRTTPEAPDLQALLAVMREAAVDSVAMEVSSHALVMGRVDGVVFDVAVFTNLSQDHLDFHADLEDYFRAKASLFTADRARCGVVEVDDAYGARLAATAADLPIVTVSTGGAGDADWRVRERDVVADAARTAFTLEHRDGTTLRPVSPLAGGFNVSNAALAAVACLTAGVPAAAVVAGLAAGVDVPGRMQRVHGTGDDEPLAVVDYAHSPDAIDNLLAALRPGLSGRLVIVLGAGGNRDRGKRPAMGAAAARHADVVVVTDDNPRSEDPAAIRAAVLGGARAQVPRQAHDVREVPDRRAAVRQAVQDLRRGDAVVIAGRGHEQGQEVAGEVRPLDDRELLREALEQENDRRRSEAAR